MSLVAPLDVDVVESGGSASVCVEITSGSLDDTESAVVTLSTSDGTAKRKNSELVTLYLNVYRRYGVNIILSFSLQSRVITPCNK